jgi:NTP pyrophosphatase (non-canonical NTP hydrolase)
MSIIDKDVLHHALELWGKDKQIYISVEELAELQKELLKNANRNEDNCGRILEELADVLVTLECLKIIYDFADGEIQAEMKRKVERLRARMETAMSFGGVLNNAKK